MALTQTEFCHLISEHAPALFRLAYRLLGDWTEAEDIVQETFQSVWKARNRYDPTRGTRAWLTTILRRRVADLLRKPRIRWHPAEQALEAVADPSSVPEEGPPAEEHFGDEMQQALDRLPADLRETLLLVVVSELTHQEAADMLNVPLGTVLSRVHRARKQLREYLASMTAKSE